MIKGVIIKNLSKFKDERGWLCEIYRNDETDYRSVMSYISVTKPNVIRGPHEHLKQSDCFVFVGLGNFDLYLWDNRKNSKTYKEHQIIRVGEERPANVIIPPGVVHGYKCISKTEAMVINLPDKLYKGEGKKEEVDEVRWEENINSPYKIN